MLHYYLLPITGARVRYRQNDVIGVTAASTERRHREALHRRGHRQAAPQEGLGLGAMESGCHSLQRSVSFC